MLPVIAKQDAEEQPFMKLRALRAIAFFGGTLSTAEKKLAAETTQADILANEGHMIPPTKR